MYKKELSCQYSTNFLFPVADRTYNTQNYEICCVLYQAYTMGKTCTEKRKYEYLFIRVVVGTVRTVIPLFLITRIA
jgi:hypothetical protein